MAPREAKGGALLRRAKRALRRGLLVNYLVKPASGNTRCEGDRGLGDGDGGIDTSSSVPGDVGEGHFAVVAVSDDEEARRFVVSLRCLSHPRFQQLLAQAQEEFGFHQQGALAIPCRPSELERVLGEL